MFDRADSEYHKLPFVTDVVLSRRKFAKSLIDHHHWLVGKGGAKASFKGEYIRSFPRVVNNLSGIDFRDAYMKDLCWKSIIMLYSDLRGAYIVDCDLSRTDFSFSKMCGAYFRNCNLDYANFRGCDIRCTTFVGIDMTFTKLEREYKNDS